MITTFIYTIENPSDQTFVLQLYERYEALMFWAAGKYLLNIEDRKDAVQDAIVTLIKNIDTLRLLEEAYLRTYVVYTVQSKSINILKRKNLELRIFEDFDSIPAGTAKDIIEEKIIQIALNDVITTAWERLPLRDQIILEGKYILGYNDNELGTLVGCKASSVRMYLTRARRKLLDLILEVEQFEIS